MHITHAARATLSHIPQILLTHSRRRWCQAIEQTLNKCSPVLRSQFERLIDDAVRHSDAQCCAAGLDLIFAPLKQNLVVALDSLLLLLF